MIGHILPGDNYSRLVVLKVRTLLSQLLRVVGELQLLRHVSSSLYDPLHVGVRYSPITARDVGRVVAALESLLLAEVRHPALVRELGADGPGDAGLDQTDVGEDDTRAAASLVLRRSDPTLLSGVKTIRDRLGPE